MEPSTRKHPRIEVRIKAITVVLLLLSAIGNRTQADILGGLFGTGADSGKLAKLQFELHDNMPVTSIVWSPDGRYIAASTNQGNKIHIWDVLQRERVHELQRGSGATDMHPMSWSPDGRYLAVCDGFYGQLRVYDAKAWSEGHLIVPEPHAGCDKIAFSSDNQQLAVLGSSLRIYATGDWRLLESHPVHGGWALRYLFCTVNYIPRTHVLVVGGMQFVDEVKGETEEVGYVWFFHPGEDRPGRQFQTYFHRGNEPVGDVRSVALSPDGKRIATGPSTGSGFSQTRIITASVHVFNISNGELVGAPLDGKGFGAPLGIEYTSDGRYLIVAHSGVHVSHAIHVLDATTLQVLDVVHAGNTVYDLAVHPQSKQFAVAAGDRIAIWSLPPQNLRQNTNWSIWERDHVGCRRTTGASAEPQCRQSLW